VELVFNALAFVLIPNSDPLTHTLVMSLAGLLSITTLHDAVRGKWSVIWLSRSLVISLLLSALALVNGWHGTLLAPPVNTRWASEDEWNQSENE
jgi:hypothetical protein